MIDLRVGWNVLFDYEWVIQIFYCKGNDEWERQLDSASFVGARGSIENTREATLKFD